MDDAKSKILRAASDLFLEGGTAALSVRAISKRAGVSTIGIYSHFKGKQGILDELYCEGFEMVFSAMDIPTSIKDPRAMILKGAGGYLDLADKYEAHYRLIFGESDTNYTPSDEAKEVAKKAFLKLVEIASVLLPVDSGYRAKQSMALEIWALVHGYVSLRHHAIADVNIELQWRDLAISAIDTHISAVLAK